MPTYEHTLDVARPPAEVFAFVTRPRNDPLWQPERLEGGARFTWTVETGTNGATRLAGPVVATATRRELAANAARLKRLLEGAGE